MARQLFEHVPAHMQADLRASNRVPLSTVIVGPSAYPQAAVAAMRTMLRKIHVNPDVINSKIPIRP
jgi:hypothetical protein